MKNLLEKILAIIFLSFILVAFFLAAKNGIEKSERNECKKWLQQAEESSLYYSTPWQLEQCREYGVKLPR